MAEYRVGVEEEFLTVHFTGGKTETLEADGGDEIRSH